MTTVQVSAYQASSAASIMNGMQAVSTSEITKALEQILASCMFIRAHRMCRLLRYLVESSLSNSRRQMNEYAIALDVFDRNPATYCPSADPIVRVQMGRLRKRLKSYYAVHQESMPVIVSIPLGHYEPVIERGCTLSGGSSENRTTTPSCQLSLFPLHYISDDLLGRTLTKCINEQLNQEFQQTFGATLIPYPSSLDTTKQNAMHAHRYFLEGSTFLHAHNLRINVRLIDQISNAIMYTAQFDMPAGASASNQAEMGKEICAIFRHFLSDISDDPVLHPIAL